MKTNPLICPLCDEKQEVLPIGVGRKTWYEYKCPKCGDFIITRQARDFLPGLQQEYPLIRKQIRRYLIDHQSDKTALISLDSVVSEAEEYTVIGLNNASDLIQM